MSTEQQTPAPAPSPEGESSHSEHLGLAAAGDLWLGRSLALVRFLRLRCDWDAGQTPETLRPYLLEEAHEVAQAILSGDDEALCLELGDLLLNLAFQIVLAEERGTFRVADVVTGLEDKMRSRHPHVYGDAVQRPNWEALKLAERRKGRASDLPVDPFEGLPSTLDELSRALRVQDRAAALNFDWSDATGPLAKLREEVDELEAASASADTVPTSVHPTPTQAAGALGAVEEDAAEPGSVEEELGDILFAAVNLVRHHGLHPSTVLGRASEKFARRFRRVLELAEQEGLHLHAADLALLEGLWSRVKEEERVSRS